jgi:hypothetical protein
MTASGQRRGLTPQRPRRPRHSASVRPTRGKLERFSLSGERNRGIGGAAVDEAGVAWRRRARGCALLTGDRADRAPERAVLCRNLRSQESPCPGRVEAEQMGRGGTLRGCSADRRNGIQRPGRWVEFRGAAAGLHGTPDQCPGERGPRPGCMAWRRRAPSTLRARDQEEIASPCLRAGTWSTGFPYGRTRAYACRRFLAA